ncbi:hypothetical protein FG93_04318 [Bosea sp. LC85]|uniref:hypothetical protein n=1 Tax=Bosea sp. LC85 TaxID=1502851 RepID=UPI0004E2FE50|nr:hypothetical protein [Bosea sp. LC85]KFC66836.1 hypothetical protein FG93_04318 [Bosea sp. LC85]
MTTSPAIHLTYRKTSSAPGRPYNSLFTVTDATGRDLCSARVPLCSAARVLLQEGHDPASIIFMTREGDASWSLKGTLGLVAKLTVRENDSVGPVFAPYDADRLAELRAHKHAA